MSTGNTIVNKITSDVAVLCSFESSNGCHDILATYTFHNCTFRQVFRGFYSMHHSYSNMNPTIHFGLWQIVSFRRNMDLRAIGMDQLTKYFVLRKIV